MAKKIIVIVVSIIVLVAAIVFGIYSLYRINFEKGNELYKAGQYEEALLAYKKAMRFTINDTNLYHALAAAHGKLGEYDEAISLCEKIVTINPNDIKAHKALGALYGIKAYGNEDEEMFRRAYEYFKKAYELEPDQFDETETKVMEGLEKESAE